MTHYTGLVFGLATAAIAILFLLSMCGLISKNFEFWPPPEKSSWQRRTFRFLFRVFFYGLVLLSAMEVKYVPIRLLAGIPLLLLGFGLAIYWTNFLGWQNAFGEAESLKTTGIYKYSRNPVYVASIVGMIGWGIAVNSAWVHMLLAIWTILYIVAPFVEEPWLIKEFGADFETYCEGVPRYFGYGKFKL